MPLLSPSELTGTADGGGSEALQALMDEHRKRRLQGELKNAFMGPDQIAQQAKADLLQFQPKKRARTMLAESTSNATAAASYGHARSQMYHNIVVFTFHAKVLSEI